MRALEIHTCPVWEDRAGKRRPGMEPTEEPVEVVGWCNVLVVEHAGETHRLLLTLEA